MWTSQETVEVHKRQKKIKISFKTLHQEVSYETCSGTDHSSETSARVFENICIPSSVQVFMVKGSHKDIARFIFADVDDLAL